jgi:class 3 adenylate cyclase
MEPSPIRYTKAGDVHIAYRTLGDGPNDLVFVSGAVSNLELDWEQPLYADFVRRLASSSRLIAFDRRGVGLSDRVATPSLEEQMEDVEAVLQAVGSERAALFGFGDGGALLALFAATYPTRSLALILYATEPRKLRAPDYPWGMTREEARTWLDSAEDELVGDAVAADLRRAAPSLAHDQEFVRWLARWLRLSTSPGAFAAFRRMNLEIDIRHVLPAIRVPTLVLERPGDEIFDAAIARYVADRIATATRVELPGRDHYPWGIEGREELLAAIEAFVREAASAPPENDADRVLLTVLFTDIVDATKRAVEVGDASWRELLREHHAVVRRQLARFRGRELDSAGDGFFATFDGPARGVRCACAIAEAVRRLGLEVRAGLHTGECELVDGKVAGIAVHIGARVAAEAEPGEVLVSSTVRDLVAGSGLRFRERGLAELKGVPDEWRLYAVERADSGVASDARALLPNGA